MAEREQKNEEFVGEKQLTDDGRKVIDEKEVEGVNASLAAVMVKHAPNPWGKGHIQLYILASVCFLNSTMSGRNAACHRHYDIADIQRV